MKPSHWPDWLNDIWAKSSTDEEKKKPGESLAEHTWLVLSRLTDLMQVRPRLAAMLCAPRLWHCLFWACFLHDFGKAASGFQNMLRGGDRWQRRHEVLSLAFLDWIAPAFTTEEQQWILAAIASHHKDAKEIDKIYGTYPELAEDMIRQIDELAVRGLWRWLAECSESWIDTLGVRMFDVHPISLLEEEKAVSIVCTQGAQRINAWVETYAESLEQFKKEHNVYIISALVMLRGLTTTADHAASAHLNQVPSGIQRSGKCFAEDMVRELQRRALERGKQEEIETYSHQLAASQQHHTSAMVIAPTGSGKTETAICWALGDGTQSTPRIFYTLPYQASMNAMYKRLCQPHYFGENSVGLQHGRALQALYQRFMDAETGPSSAKEITRWSLNLNKLHAYPVKVFSPYQMLKVVYQIKGFEAMLADYTQAAFIFDEIHAYDAHRLALILALVKHLRERYQARFLVMSATFPLLLRKIMPDVLGVDTPIRAEPELFKRFRRHKLALLDGNLLEDGIERVVADVRRGKSVLVCCNTVQRAQVMYAALLLKLPLSQVELLHSRFTMEDRLQVEEAVLNRCESGGEHSTMAVVATQVVEVSLNIDLDTIYSDPAPLDALIQRFGRINRAREKGIVPVHVFREPRDGQGVYQELLVQRTLEELELHNEQEIDEAAIEAWLNAIYTAPAIHDPWMKMYHQQFSNAELLLRDLRPFDSDAKLEEKFDQLFDGVEVLPRCFERRYLEHMEKNELIEASHLFVPISYKKYQYLASRGKIRQLGDSKQKKWMTLLEYDKKLGLLFDTSQNVPYDES
jgi:CRISPR-associated endonuclease/helicase Cas3